MPSDYTAIRADNQQRYGTDIARIGQMLLADRYDDRTHFIFELLQNAEDALVRRKGWPGARSVQFRLESDVLQLSHYGQPFDDRDVRGICGIAESTKDEAAIGRFGIGFKSVYAYTTRPEVHSGDESFAIESFVWPTAAPDIGRDADQTVITLPLDAGPPTAHSEIAKGLQRLGLGTLLFLREIEEIEWNVGQNSSGVYLRSKAVMLESGIRRITVVGEETGRKAAEECWLIFFRDVSTDEGVVVGQVEIAFSILGDPDSKGWSIQPVANSSLVVFFPTIVPTNLGFVVQGPYHTTPSRDNVPRSDSWNQRLVKETASLLEEALVWLRDNGHLDVAAFRCLPLDRTKFPEASMFAPLFESVRNQLKSCRLLPTHSGGHVLASASRLARTHELRHLFKPDQLGALLGTAGEVSWLSGDISQDRSAEIRQYLMRELEIAELTPELILARLNKAFLEAQSDEWVLSLYEFLHGQPALQRSSRISLIPVIRLSDGSHVTVLENGQARAFLPSVVETKFPTVRKAVCGTKDARKFLEALGLTEPDPVDDVIWNILPKYLGAEVEISDDAYRADIRRILEGFGTDSKTQREKLISALRGSSFVMSIDAGSKTKYVSKPGDLYFATARLKDLFDGVENVYLVDDEYDCLRGEDVRDLLEACGTSRSLQTIAAQPKFTWMELRDMRIAAGCEDSTGVDHFTDYSLRGIDQLLAAFSGLDHDTQVRKASLLWEALGDLQDRRGVGVFSGLYQYHYYHSRSASFDASFVQKLNITEWIPDADGGLRKPSDLVFDVMGWKPNPFLLSKIRFKPPLIEMLAREAGIEPGILDLLRRLGVTSEADLRARLGEVEDTKTEFAAEQDDSKPEDDGGDNSEETDLSTVEADSSHDKENSSFDEGVELKDDREANTPEGNRDETDPPFMRDKNKSSSKERKKPAEGEEGRTFISYIAAHPDDDEGSDPDGLDQQARMALEEKAIKLILDLDPRLERTPTNNRGFDLVETDGQGITTKWVEVKSMTGELVDRPVCLSRAQFDCAWMHGEDYWLYIVEHAGESGRARLLRINDPAGKAKNFAFDQGWRKIADLSDSHSAEAMLQRPE